MHVSHAFAPGVGLFFMESFLSNLWEFFVAGPPYAHLMAAVGIECLVFLGFVAALLLQLWTKRRREAHRQTFEEEFEPDFRRDLEEGNSLGSWADRFESYPDDVVRNFLVSLIDRENDPELVSRLVQFYRSIDLIEQDREALRSNRPQRHIEALRRMLRVATEEDRRLLLEEIDYDHHLARVLTGRILSKVGSAEDLVTVFRHLSPETRLMEEPVFTIFAELPSEELELMCQHWNEFSSPRIRRIILEAAADRGLEAVLPLLKHAARSDDMEMRIGACDPLAMFEGRETLDLLLDLLEDDAWQVRARAASALGRRGDFGITEPLAEAMEDSNFWVRQNAATSLRRRGRMGIRRLRHILEESEDPFAVDTASQELQRHEISSRAGGERA